MSETSIRPDEVRKFAGHAERWWDPNGPEAMLHKLNPVRLEYVRDRIDQHWQSDECSRTPLSGKSALDVGCGAGLLTEPLVRMGAKVTGIDAAAQLITVARTHAEMMGMKIDYRAGDLFEIEGEFDLITCMEVIEHVADPKAFVTALSRRLAPGGLLVMSTPNATSWSKLLTITLGEGLGRIPRGTHQFDQFIAPDCLKQLLADAGLTCVDVEGIAWSPMKGLHLSDDLRLNYLVAAAYG